MKNLKSKISGFLIISAVGYALLAASAYAQYGFTDILDNAPGQELGVQWFFNLLSNLTCYSIRLAIIIFGIMLLVYGLMFFKSRGSAQGIADARKALTWGLVGGLIIFGVFTIILTVAYILGVDLEITDFITCS